MATTDDEIERVLSMSDEELCALMYDFRLRQGMHAAERCAKAIGALPDDATGSAT